MITGPTDKLNARTIAWINHIEGKAFHVAVSAIPGAAALRSRLVWTPGKWLPKDPFNWYNRMAVMVIWKDQNEQIGVLHGAN